MIVDLQTSEWTLMALESLMNQLAQVADLRGLWRKRATRAVSHVSEYVEDRASASLVRVLVESCGGFPVLLPAVATTPSQEDLASHSVPKVPPPAQPSRLVAAFVKGWREAWLLWLRDA